MISKNTVTLKSGSLKVIELVPFDSLPLVSY